MYDSTMLLYSLSSLLKFMSFKNYVFKLFFQIGSTSYRFEVYSVDKCPTNKSEFEEAAIRMNCSQDDKRYLCAPNRNLSNLIEFCTDVRRSLFGPGIQFCSLLY